MKLSIVIPILNEREILEESITKLFNVIASTENNQEIEVIVADAGSKDGSASVASDFCHSFNWKFVTKDLVLPSIARTVFLGLRVSVGSKVIILPIDCEISSKHLGLLLSTKADYGGFYKKYNPNNLLLSFYAFLQNYIRAKLFKNIVWTNGIFFKRELIDRDIFLNLGGFMEDVFLSDLFKKRRLKFKLFSEKIKVSSRLYVKNTPVLRIFTNGLIMFLFRFKIVNSVDRLKRIYKVF